MSPWCAEKEGIKITDALKIHPDCPLEECPDIPPVCDECKQWECVCTPETDSEKTKFKEGDLVYIGSHGVEILSFVTVAGQTMARTLGGDFNVDLLKSHPTSRKQEEK